MQHHTALVLDLQHHVPHCTERGDDYRHPIAQGQFQVGLQPAIAAVHDEIDRERRHLRIARQRALAQSLGDGLQPLLIALGGTFVQCRKRADHAIA
ncbi:hypothetical protein WJ970_35115 [Achromobacter xylosoxidans]